MGGSRLSGAGGNWITARPVGVRGGVDHQFTGEVRRVDTETIAGVLAQDRIALLSPIGYSPTGETFNLRAEELATAVARSEEHTSELQSLMRISYAVFCLKKKTTHFCTHHLTPSLTNTLWYH